MSKYWRYIVVGVVAFLIGSATIASAQGIQRFVITDKGGKDIVKVGSAGRLHVNVKAGALNVRNFPKNQKVSGEVDISNLPAVQEIDGAVSVENFPENQQVSGSVSVTNIPEVQSVQGDVAVSNFPVTQAVSVTNIPETQDVLVTNLPETQAVSGAVSVTNLPETQPVSGNVAVTNFPGVQQVSGKVQIGEPDLPDPATIVNLIADQIEALGPQSCTIQNGFSYTVPEGKALLITDVVGSNLWTDARGRIFRHDGKQSNQVGTTAFNTPLVITSGQTVCPDTHSAQGPVSFLVSGRLVDSS